MNSAEFTAGLNTYNTRHDHVQHELGEIEQNAISFRDMSRYRQLLDELVQINMERARYCAHWNATHPEPSAVIAADA